MIYKFTDTDKRATPGNLPGEALFINGQAIENLIEGYRTLYVKGRESMSAEINLAEQGRANGSAFNYKRYPERTLTIGFQIIAKTNEEYRKKFNALGGILNVEQAQLIFNDELDKYFTGTPGEISEIEGGSNKVVGEFNIVCADPFKYAVDQKIISVPIDTDIEILYDGTVPTYPVIYSDCPASNDNTALWFESFSINDNLLVLQEDGEGGTVSTGTSGPVETTSDGWTIETYTITAALDEYRIEGKLNYTRNHSTDIFRINIYGDTYDEDFSPCIQLYRDYTNGYPITELRFMVGEEIVYRQTIDDAGKNRFPFRLSFSHTSAVSSVRAGQMTGNYYFQFGDITYSFRKSWNWNESMSVNTTVRIYGAKMQFQSSYMSTMVTGYSGSFMHIWTKPIDKCGSQFPYDDVTIVKPGTGEILVAELNTPRFGNPANRWEAFKLVPGVNKLRCNAFGSSRSNFSARFYFREVYI